MITLTETRIVEMLIDEDALATIIRRSFEEIPDNAIIKSHDDGTMTVTWQSHEDSELTLDVEEDE